MGRRPEGGPIEIKVMPMLEAKNPVAPVIVKFIKTFGSCLKVSSTRSCKPRICSGEEPSLPIKTPKITPLSPGGRNDLGMVTSSRMVPARQTTQIAAEIHRCLRNHQSDEP